MQPGIFRPSTSTLQADNTDGRASGAPFTIVGSSERLDEAMTELANPSMWLFDHLREDARGSGYRALRPVSNYSRQWKVVAPGAPARRR